MPTPPDHTAENPPKTHWRLHLHEVIFEADTKSGKVFDIALLIAILLSISCVTLETVERFQTYSHYFWIMEWVFTVLFSIEYVARLISVAKPHKYALSFFGIIDLLAILPTFLSLFIAGSQSLVVIRGIRLLRVFRIFKLARYLSEAEALYAALKRTRAKITVFLVIIFTFVMIMGALTYLVEGPEHGFTSIPRSVYWAVVTMTTVGYGDLVPQTEVGQLIASIAMVLGYSIIIVPTGIFSAEVMQARQKQVSTQACLSCSLEGHDFDAKYCKHCGVCLTP